MGSMPSISDPPRASAERIAHACDLAAMSRHFKIADVARSDVHFRNTGAQVGLHVECSLIGARGFRQAGNEAE